MHPIDDLKDLRKKAEEAVAGMADGDLKTKAFEVILQHLLSVQAPASQPEPAEIGPRGKKKTWEKQRRDSTSSRILLLKDEGFFKVPRSFPEIKVELSAHSWFLSRTSLTGPLQRLVSERYLRRLKVREGKKGMYKYVNP